MVSMHQLEYKEKEDKISLTEYTLETVQRGT